MNINFENFKSKFAISLKPLVVSAFFAVIEELNLINQLEITVALKSQREIKLLNKKFRNINKVTDVLSFPLLNLSTSKINQLPTILVCENFKNDINPITKNISLGDIAICIPQIKKQAKQFDNSVKQEFTHMIVHGILHLLGFDHTKESHKKQMIKVEELCLKTMTIK